MQIAGMTAEDMKANLRQAEARVEAALTEYEAAKAELAWWQQGLRLVDPKAAAAVDAGQDPAAMVTELFPNGLHFENGMRPTLRQAIVLVMRTHSEQPWTIKQLAEALSQCGWLPDQKDAAKRVSDMAGNMYDLGQLSRLARGVYKLSPPLTAALEATTRPITDYGVAARHGFPVPERGHGAKE
jgi:hypothetical protein